MSSCTSGLKKPKSLVSQTCTVPKPTREFFSLRLPNSLVNVILPRFWHVQDFFYILASFVQMKEMMLWSALAIISLPCSSGVW